MRLRDRLIRLDEQRKGLEQQIADLEHDIDAMTENRDNHVKARHVLIEVTKLTQQNFKEYIEPLITLAIRSVYSDRDLKFELQFDDSHNKPIVKPVILENEHEYIPDEDELGGGIYDVISFALRVIMWSIEKPRTRALFVLDEPMKWTGSLITKAGEMIKNISRKLNIQIIMVSHSDELIQIADKAWRVTHDGKFSHVEELNAKKKKRKLVRRK